MAAVESKHVVCRLLVDPVAHLDPRVVDSTLPLLPTDRPTDLDSLSQSDRKVFPHWQINRHHRQEFIYSFFSTGQVKNFQENLECNAILEFVNAEQELIIQLPTIEWSRPRPE